jgi:hypothetical protein
MLQEKAKFTADEVACYLTKRLIHGGKPFRPDRTKGWFKEELRTRLKQFRFELFIPVVSGTHLTGRKFK